MTTRWHMSGFLSLIKAGLHLLGWIYLYVFYFFSFNLLFKHFMPDLSGYVCIYMFILNGFSYSMILGDDGEAWRAR